jgi:hypothetical protein
MDDPIHFTTDNLPIAAADIAASSHVVATSSHLPADIRGYYFATDEGSPNFTSFQIPGLLPDQSYRLWAEGAYREVTGDEIVDFTSFSSNGISRFYLLGIGTGVRETFPHVFAATFAAEGVGDFFLVSVAVPEPVIAVHFLTAAIFCGVAAGRSRAFIRAGKKRKR